VGSAYWDKIYLREELKHLREAIFNELGLEIDRFW